MEIKVLPGKYVIAVSGGVDSMVLLDVLRQKPELTLLVAHFNHGIRKDSHLDGELVEQAAKAYNLQFVYEEGGLGAGASEDAARKARYAFLHRIREESGSAAVITAHHQDDMLETAILNLIRGTNRRGITALRSTSTLLRPLLGTRKQEILEYAKARKLVWREDSTNLDMRYRRNHIRHNILPKLKPHGRHKLLALVEDLQITNAELDAVLEAYIAVHTEGENLKRQDFIMLPHTAAREVMAAWLRARGVGYDQKTLERLVVAAKTYWPNRYADVQDGYRLFVSKDFLALRRLDR